MSMLPNRQSFEDQLAALVARVHLMGESVIQAFTLALRALEMEDASQTGEIFALDKERDKNHAQLEKDCLLLMTRQQPVASDLRLVTGTLKLADDLERIGDHAIHLARRVRESVSQETPISDPRVVAYGNKMLAALKLSLRALAENDREAAGEVIAQEDELHRLGSELESQLMHESSLPGADASSLMGRLLVIHSIHRAAAHSVNVAERAIFEITGHRPHRGV